MRCSAWCSRRAKAAAIAAGGVRAVGIRFRGSRPDAPPGWGDAASIALAVSLAFFFGYSLTLIPLLRAGIALKAAVGIALVADTLSIATMELVDNAILLLWPGAMDAYLDDALFWIALGIALAVAWGPTFLVNRALIRRGKGHALAHAAHGHGH